MCSPLHSYPFALTLALVSASAVGACNARPSSPSPSSPAKKPHPDVPAGKIVATVNGKILTELDLLTKLKTDSHQDDLRPEYRKNVLELLVRDELVHQEVVRLGLDSDPGYAEPVRRMEAQLAQLRRNKAAEVYFRAEIMGKVEVTEEDARRFFEEQKARLGTELHLLQILRRSRASIDEAKAALDAGKSFEEVAQHDLVGVSPEQRAWDLGYLRWAQIPEAWQPVVEKLKPGEASGVLAGPKDRFWIIKLVERRSTTPDFAVEKAGLIATLKARRIEALRAEREQALRKQATIVIPEVSPPPAPTN